MILGLFAVAYWVFYVIPNFFSTGPAFELPLLWIDRWVPFLPWSFLVYTSDYFVFAIAILALSRKDEFHSFARLMFGILIICGAFFYFYPTTYPRPPYPDHQHWFVESVMNFVANADTPRNCFPSMHVALTAGATWALRVKGPKIFLLFTLWSLAVFASTLSTKQHYFLDILGGLVVTSVVIGLEVWAPAILNRISK
jgi:hypothetical protein